MAIIIWTGWYLSIPDFIISYFATASLAVKKDFNFSEI